MTSTYELGVDVSKTYQHNKSEFATSMLLKVRTRIKQTDTETDATKRRIAKAALLNINLTDSKFKKKSQHTVALY